MTKLRNGCWPRTIRVAAAADYLIGLPCKVITVKHGVPICTVVYWIRMAGFKTRLGLKSQHKTVIAREAKNAKQKGQDD